MAEPATTQQDLVVLAQALAAAKVAEERARKHRVACEERIIEATGYTPGSSRGTQSFTAQHGDRSAKFTLTQPISTKVDAKAFFALRLPKSHPANACVRTKLELDAKAAKILETEDPASYAKLAECLTRKPGKISVKLDSYIGGGA